MPTDDGFTSILSFTVIPPRKSVKSRLFEKIDKMRGFKNSI